MSDIKLFKIIDLPQKMFSRNHNFQNRFLENENCLDECIGLKIPKNTGIKSDSVKKYNFATLEKDYNDNDIMRRNIQTKNNPEEYICKKRIIKYKRANYNLKINYIMIFVFIIFHNILKACLQTKVINYYSIITIKIKKSGRRNILFGGDNCDRGELFSRPDEVIINKAKQYCIETQYYFEGTNNVIQLKWNEKTENWGCLFKFCNDIDEIDFSQFDFSQKIRGNKMLFGCSSITSLNINYFDKVKLIDAGSFFRQMSSLTSLNLSNFDMSEVTDIGWMFQGCTSLTSLDLTCLQYNSISEPVTHIFWECPI